MCTSKTKHTYIQLCILDRKKVKYIKNLKNLGFEELQPNLYRKNVTENTFLFRDYRGDKPKSYAYFKAKTINHYFFKDAHVIEKIEKGIKANQVFIPGKLSSYF